MELQAGEIVALTTAGASLLATTAMGIWTARTRRKHDEALLRLEDRIQGQAKERDARLDYEYEARKRLYEQFEPLLFPLLEAAETAMSTVFSLARTARRGEIMPDGSGWLEARGYYHLSIVHRLLSPLAHIHLLRRELTFVDLRLDPMVARRYLICKCLASTFTDDFDLAKQEPSLAYSPHAPDAERGAVQEPGVYVQQGIPLGILDAAIRSLIDEAPAETGRPRVWGFGEFEEAYKRDQLSGTQLEWVLGCFSGFHPFGRPVLWRVLIAQFFLYYCLIYKGETNELPGQIVLDATTRDRMDWRHDSSESTDAQAIDIPIRAARTYLDKQWAAFAPALGLPASR